VGTIPNLDETRQFLTDADPDKRKKLIDRLLDDPRFGTQQAHVWDLILFGRNPGNIEATRKRDGFKQWLAERFQKNMPYDEWIREMLLAEHESPALYYVQYRNAPEEAATAVSRIFLGKQIQCARCHDHPFDRWKQTDFFGMAGFFVRLQVLESGPANEKIFAIGEKSTGEVLFTGAVKDQKPGQKGTPVAPKFLDGDLLNEPTPPPDFKEADWKSVTPKNVPKPFFSRKAKLAEWITDVKNPYFTHALANRLWSQFLGRGIVQPVDDISEQNAPTHPELLDALTKHLADSKFDTKLFIREIVNSTTYQLSHVGSNKQASPRQFERARTRPLSCEELLASIRVATHLEKIGGKPESYTDEYALRALGDPFDGQGHFQPSLAEHLFLNNSSHIRSMITRKKGNLADLLALADTPWEERLDTLFLSVLQRLPRLDERAKFLAYAKETPNAKLDSVIEEMIWVLINSVEFRFNH
jgi:hypothetical protein